MKMRTCVRVREGGTEYKWHWLYGESEAGRRKRRELESTYVMEWNIDANWAATNFSTVLQLHFLGG